MRRSVVVIFIVACLLCSVVCGCTQKTAAPSQMAKTIREIEAYLQSCGQGLQVSEIEDQLRLPEPSEMEAPTSDWPHWKFKYFVNDLVVAFLADKTPDGQEGFVYVGKPKVWLVADYWCEVRKKAPTK